MRSIFLPLILAYTRANVTMYADVVFTEDTHTQMVSRDMLPPLHGAPSGPHDMMVRGEHAKVVTFDSLAEKI